ncbi:MAG: MFS transporter [Betaproteobacteria bacterium HGW-Betaproteobacteria-12]|nr:MAG: MFS transporter [Betaproteobacteria bacterium HGW-Betaproteobacteria-12]
MMTGGWSSHLGEAIVGRAPALGQRNFRRYFYGQICSVLGTFIQAVALSWLVYRLTGSPALLGLTAFLSQAPQLVVAPLAGVMIDRFDRRRLMIGLQCIFAAQALTLAALVFFDAVEVWHLLALAALLGVLNSFDLPTRQSLLLYLVDDKSTLANAVALNAAVVHSGRLLGPPIAGLLLAFVPESVCFLINALSYLGPISAVLAIRAEIPRQRNLKTGSALLEVLAFIRGNPSARGALLAVAMVNVTASSYVVLMPVFAKDVFAGSAQALGWLLGMGGAGALTASLYLSTRARAELNQNFMIGSCAVAAVGMIGFSLAGYCGSLGLGMPMVGLIGAGIGATNIVGNTRLQHLAPEGLRGRVISIFGSTRFGFDALGGLFAGALAAGIGVLPVTAGLGLLLLPACLGLSRTLKPCTQPR